MLRKLLVPLLAVVLCGTTATVAQASGGHNPLDRVRHATARYHSLDVAQGAGYGLLRDADGIACIDMPGKGAMGVHYVNGDLVGDGAITPLRPEALVYRPDARGRLRLAGVEYVVFAEAWDAAHRRPPSLFGRRFDFTASPNRYGLPAFYSLHAWVWKRNPAGTFAMWNPRVSCATYDEGTLRTATQYAPSSRHDHGGHGAHGPHGTDG
ncbi:MAG TPA: hypothetical protein VFT95_00465 [Micromonosporaceae bacterium]|nr:hypothetical protein [Micromonosporaceae bacterium]